MFWRKKKEVDLQKVALNEYDRQQEEAETDRQKAIDRAVKHFEKKFKIPVDKILKASYPHTYVVAQGYCFAISDRGYSEHALGRQWEIYLYWECDKQHTHQQCVNSYADIGRVLVTEYGKCSYR